MTSHGFAHRLQQVQRQIPAHQAWLITNANDVQYLTGFISLVAEEREALLLLTPTKTHLFFAAFSPISKLQEINYYPGVYSQKIKSHLESIFAGEIKTPLTELAIDEHFLSVDEYRVFETFAQSRQLKLTALNTKPLQQLRMVKEASELTLLEQAGQAAAKAWTELEPWLKPGLTEQQVKQKLEQLLLEFGSQRPAFPTIVAFGPNSALPHHQPTETILTENNAVLIDFGATVGEYRSDMTRTVWVGSQPDPLFTKIKTVVMDAYSQTLVYLNAQVAAGPANGGAGHTPKALDLDDAARSIIKKAGYENEFIHTTGHGIGLDIHEQPSLSWSNTTEIKPGFVITIEPGIYLEGKFGFRYENTVSVSQSTASELTI